MGNSFTHIKRRDDATHAQRDDPAIILYFQDTKLIPRVVESLPLLGDMPGLQTHMNTTRSWVKAGDADNSDYVAYHVAEKAADSGRLALQLGVHGDAQRLAHVVQLGVPAHCVLAVRVLQHKNKNKRIKQMLLVKIQDCAKKKTQNL